MDALDTTQNNEGMRRRGAQVQQQVMEVRGQPWRNGDGQMTSFVFEDKEGHTMGGRWGLGGDDPASDTGQLTRGHIGQIGDGTDATTLQPATQQAQRVGAGGETEELIVQQCFVRTGEGRKGRKGREDKKY